MKSPIVFKNVYKKYLLTSTHRSIREDIVSFLCHRKKESPKSLFALKDVSFEIYPAEILAIIGVNGSGKSTILKIISRVTYPTDGNVKVKGRVAPLLELGAGFHPDLSGRENICVNASILGMRRREIRERLNKIIEFSELERFIDLPIKRYSSGMYMRLAFSIAIHSKADIFLIDEVLSVGDVFFRQKCLSAIKELHKQGKTIIFVSHNMEMVKNFAQRVMLLAEGKIEKQGRVEEVLERYLN